jgi:hypothetical protein
MEHEQRNGLALPVGVANRADVGRLIRDTEALDNYIRQWAIKNDGTQFIMPRVSRLFNEIISTNKLNVLQSSDRKALMQFLSEIKAEAPVLHMSFTSDPSPVFTTKLMTWLRNEIHPHVLIQIGLQPNMGAGCILRTTNKYFDFSLRKQFADEKDNLLQLIHHVNEAPAEVPQPAPAGPQEIPA